MQPYFTEEDFGANDEHVADTIVKARKSWKTVKGKSEPVWPPHLEKSLVQALLQYKPTDTRYARALGRFPKRNRFISDFIFEATGVRRSPKQVGSRLQQLKDVTCGKQLLNHVASWSLNPNSIAGSGTLGSNLLDYRVQGDSPSPNSSLAQLGGTSVYATSDSSSPRATSLYSPSTSYGSPPVTPHARRLTALVTFDPAAAASMTDQLQPLKSFAGCLARPETVFAADKPAAPLALVGTEPTASFTSRDPIAAQSVTALWVSPSAPGDHAPLRKVGTYSDPLTCMQTPAAHSSVAPQSFYTVGEPQLSSSSRHAQAQRECFVYKTHLVDNPMWVSLCRERAGLSRYSITQDLVYSFDSPTTRRGEVFLSISYHFVCATPFLSPSHSLGIHGSISPVSSSSSSSPSLEHANPGSLLHPHSYTGAHQHQAMHGRHSQSQLLQQPYAVHSHGYSTHPQLSLPTPTADDMGMVNMKNYLRVQPQNALVGGSPTPADFAPSMGLGATTYGLEYEGLGLTDIDVHNFRLSASPHNGNLGLL
ncbi:hypothetical protein M0805_000705 [Coniferiporia weirii]|nr:hypothetical protein M0805_000705 [Coniferiporia weirii]